MLLLRCDFERDLSRGYKKDFMDTIYFDWQMSLSSHAEGHF
jgi:hypothetical protein